MEIKTVTVVGAGIMGSGIAQSCAEGGFSTLLVDQTLELAGRGRQKIAGYLRRKVEKGRLAENQVAEILDRLSIGGMDAVTEETDLVIEAVTENLAVKQEVFRLLDKVCRPDAILATNTSTLSITRIGGSVQDPSRVIGMHFFVPAPAMALVELIPGLRTDPGTAACCADFVQRIGKTPIQAPDTPGFLVNRLLVPMWNEAAYLVMEGGSPHSIDTAMKLGGNLPMGPLELADFAGLDTVLATMTQLYAGFDDCKYRPCPLLKRMVWAGHLGRKTGRGFYTYGTE